MYRSSLGQVEIVEVCDDDAQPAAEFLEFVATDLTLHGRIRYAGDVDILPAAKIVGGGARSAPEIQQPHVVLELQQQIVGRVATREWQARKDTRAVIVSLGAVWPENVIVGTMLVIVLEKVFYLGLPFDQLAPFELVELVTDPSRVLWM